MKAIRHTPAVLQVVVFLNIGLCAAVAVGAQEASASPDLTIIPLFDGRQSQLVNTWGGYWSVGRAQKGIDLKLQETPVGEQMLCIQLARTEAAETRYLQCFASGFGRTGECYQTRDLARYRWLRFRVKNATGVPIRGHVQVKDYRDSLDHRATYPYEIPERSAWQSVEVPLALANAGWKVDGGPDFGRVLSLDFLFQPSRTLAEGQICLSDVALVEPGGPLYVDSSPLPALVDRVAHRQWDGLWAARNRRHGLMPNNSYQSTDAALNTTAAVLWMLPAAVERRWVEPGEAEQFVQLLVRTLDRLRADCRYVPSRYVDWITLMPSGLSEESSVDAAFLALALYKYESLTSTPSQLREAIGRTRNRFDFAAFASPDGWRMGYYHRPACGPEGFTGCTYNAYTNEGNLISLAAHLTSGRSIPIETYWSQGTRRLRVGLSPLHRSPVVHPMTEFRAPFAQALWNLFVDVRDRGVDTYPDRQLAVNPWQNFVCYEQNVMAKLAEMDRPYLVQPDAGDDGTLNCYRQFSMYDGCGQEDLFMPWSAALALLSGADRSEAAFRFVLHHRLVGCFGLADSARWTTGQPAPSAVTVRHDFWNTCLATMALLEWSDGPKRLSRSFATLPTVRSALDRVFLPPTRE